MEARAAVARSAESAIRLLTEPSVQRDDMQFLSPTAMDIIAQACVFWRLRHLHPLW